MLLRLLRYKPNVVTCITPCGTDLVAIAVSIYTYVYNNMLPLWCTKTELSLSCHESTAAMKEIFLKMQHSALLFMGRNRNSKTVVTEQLTY